MTAPTTTDTTATAATAATGAAAATTAAEAAEAANGSTGGTGGTTKAPESPRGRFADLRRTVRLFRRFMGSPKVYLWGIALLVFEAATAVLEPYPIAYLIDFLQGARPSLREMGWPTLVSSERIETLILLTAGIVLIAAINSAADSMVEVCMARGGRSLGYSVRVAMYSHLQRLSLAYHDKKRTGDVLTRVTGDVLVFEEFVVKSVSNILGSLLVLVGSFALLLYQSWSIALIALLVVPLLGVVSNYYSRRIKAASKAQRTSEGELASTAQEMLTSIRLVQSYGRGKVDLDRFADQTQKSMHASLGAANIQATFSFVIALVEAAAISAVVWLGVWLVDRQAITIGTLVLFVLLLQNMFKPARKIVSEWYKIGKVFASVERIDDLLDRDVVVQDRPGAVPAPPLSGRLAFRQVRFTYPAEHEDGSAATLRPTVLDGIDFEAAPGEVVALVGPSGAGKSTIAQLVPRLYDPDEGAVLVDGADVRSYTLASLRAQVSLVLQDTVLLSGSVAENIAYGIADATPERIEAAARMANAHDFITAMPDGYETQLAERGATLSGGQRQRIAIARAFIRETPILILDEPTTGLDLESTQLVLNALRDLMQGKTTIVISHDPGLIACADRVLVMSGGRIVESGEDTQSVLDGEPGPAVALERLQEGREPQVQVPAAADPPPGTEARGEPATEAPAETSVETPDDVRAETAAGAPAEAAVQAPAETAAETAPVDTPVKPAGEVAETPAETGAETTVETAAESAAETVAETPVETPAEAPAETPAETAETPAATAADTSATVAALVSAPVSARLAALATAGAGASAAASPDGPDRATPTSPPATGRPNGPALAARIGDRLPGLPLALDEGYVAGQLAKLLVSAGTQVRSVRVRSLWWRPDGTCSVRYQLEVSHGDGPVRTATVLGRVFPNADAAVEYVTDQVLAMTPHSPPQDPAWRTWAAVCTTAGLAVHPFPVDPALPSLPRALQLPRVGRLVEPEPPPGSVEVVRHAREGTCVLHFSSGDQQAGQTVDGQRARGVYGKVYGPSAAQTGDHVLGMLRELRSSVDPAAVRLPEPLWYDRRGKMLLTRALPGAPLLPARLRQLFAPDAGAGDRPGQAADLLELIQAAGAMLASLHRAAVPSAPVHLLAAELERVTDQLEVVAEVWPDSAAQVSRLVMALVRHAAPAPRLVVCHGDFTPSQLLLVRAGDSGRPDQVSLGGLVDLDTACWADPALDLGRFLAHVDLLATKIGGQAAEHCRAEIAGVLLDGYRDQAARGGIDDRELVRRVAVFRGLSLARTALRSCRQLKDDRFSIALSLLETAHTWTGKAD